MAAQSDNAAPAAANATPTAGSAEAGALTPQQTAAHPLLSSSPTAAFDVEDLLDRPQAAPEPAESNQETDPPSAEEQPATDEVQSTSDQAGDPEEEVAPEEVEDQNGKRLVSANHLERALKQRATAKEAAREATAKAEAAEAKAAALETQLAALTEKPAAASLPLAGLAPEGFDLQNEDHLAKLETLATNWLKWCKRNPMGGTPVKDGDEWDVEAVVNQQEWAEAVLKAVPETRDFKTAFATERAKVKAELPDLFKPGTADNAAYIAEQRKILSAGTAKDQDTIIARQVLTKDIPLKELATLAAQYREKQAGTADFPRVPKKPAPSPAAPASAKPKTVTVTTRPVLNVKPGAQTGSRQTIAERLAAGPVDAEEFLRA
jgi:hypothetical protein